MFGNPCFAYQDVIVHLSPQTINVIVIAAIIIAVAVIIAAFIVRGGSGKR